MEVKFVHSTGIIKLGLCNKCEKEVQIPKNVILKFYKCKKLNTLYGCPNIVEMAIYFKIINYKDIEYKIIVDILFNPFKRIENTDSLIPILTEHNVTDIAKTCDKVIKSLKHDYF